MALREGVPEPQHEGGESRRDRFVRIAKKRTQSVIDRLRILSNCANRGAYEYSEADVEKIFGAIASELQEARRRFERTKKPKEFEL